MEKFDFPPLYPGKQKKVHNSKVRLCKKICSCLALQYNFMSIHDGHWSMYENILLFINAVMLIF